MDVTSIVIGINIYINMFYGDEYSNYTYSRDVALNFGRTTSEEGDKHESLDSCK